MKIQDSLEKINEVDYGDDVIEAANLAIAIQKEDYTTNIELSLACENLPRMDTFSQSDPMIVVYLDKESNVLSFCCNNKIYKIEIGINGWSSVKQKSFLKQSSQNS